jgi:transketolase
MAIANPESKVFVLLSDGDLNEGSTWEAIMFAGQRKLHNLVAIVDWNRLQAMGESAKILDMKLLSRKVAEFGWAARDADGHDHYLLKLALTGATKQGKGPCMIIAHTIKGKGVSWMEGDVRWHYRYPSNDELDRALTEIRKHY